MNEILINIQPVQQRIKHAKEIYHRKENIKLLAVSKGQSITKIQSAIQAGQFAFGENYLQEALTKIHLLQNEKEIEWHFIGHLQSNKTKEIAQHFSWVHSIDRLKIAEKLNQYRPAHLPPLNVCIEINVAEESSKSGVAPEEALTLAQAIVKLPHLKLRGLMAIPPIETVFEKQRTPYANLKKLFFELKEKGFAIDTLSMGMSNDFEAAIAEGSTIVRIGSLIFGERNK